MNLGAFRINLVARCKGLGLGWMGMCSGCLSWILPGLGFRLRQPEHFEGGHFYPPERWVEKGTSFALPLSPHIGKWTKCPLPLFCRARGRWLWSKLSALVSGKIQTWLRHPAARNR
jgi:hypothetical protein